MCKIDSFLETNNLIGIFNLSSNVNLDLIKSVSFYLRSFLIAKYENQLDVFINFNDQAVKKIYSSFEGDSIDESEDFGIKKFFQEQSKQELPSMNPLNLSYVLSMILCENHSRKLSCHLKSSILIINSNVSVPSSQYVQYMNTIFEAQRNGIKINVLDLMDESQDSNVLLKQAASITSGYYMKINSVSEVIPVLLNLPAEMSSKSQAILNLPKQEIIDFRGSCFCHGKVVDLGYVCSVCLSVLLAVFGIQIALVSANSGRAIVGIDYGTTNVRMGMLRSGVGSVEIVLSFESDRKTINAVAYRDESIFFSQTAMNMFPKFPKAIFCRMNKLLGKFFASQSVQEYRETFIHEIAEDPVRKTVLITDPVHGHLVPIEEIAATFFTHLMDQAEKHAGYKVIDCVISVPSYFDHFERQAVLDAAKIAGFNVLSLINSVSAAALFKTTTANDLSAPTNFVIYDSGSGGTSAALVRIDPKKTVDGVTAKSMEILGLESDAGLGGDLIDDRIASFLISKFESKNPGVKVTSGKPRNKVLVEAGRIKKILNANDRATASLEDLVEEYGMSASVTREEIDALLVDLAPRFIAPVKNLLEKNKLSLNDISAILMIGGNSRHQFLLKSLKSSFGPEKLSVTLDPDESIVKGATLYGAKVHPAFVLRPTHFMDISPSGIYLQYSEILDGSTKGEIKRVELFPDVSPLQTRKSLTLKKIDNVLVDLFYSRNDQKIGSVSVKGFNDALEKVASSGKHIISSKMRIPVFLSSSGHVIIENPVAAVDYEEIVSKKVYKTHTKTPDTTSTPTPTPEATDASAEGTVTPTPTPTEKPEITVETKVVEEKVKKSKNYDLPHEIQFEMPPMNRESIAKCQKTINDAREKEFEKTRIANARNDLEKAVYRIQGELNNVDFLTYASNSERSSAKNQLNKISKFLAEAPSEKITAEIYINHLQDLVKVESIVTRRQFEEQERPGAIEALHIILNSAKEFADHQKTINPLERPQTDEELAALTKKHQEIAKWLQEKTKKQANTSKNVDPVLTLADLKTKNSELEAQFTLLKSKKMPIKVEEVKVTEDKPEESSKTEDVTESQSENKPPVEDPTQTDKHESAKTTESIPEDLVEEHFEL